MFIVAVGIYFGRDMESSPSPCHKTNHFQSLLIVKPITHMSHPHLLRTAIHSDPSRTHRDLEGSPPQAPANQRRSAHGILGAAIARSPPLREARLSTLWLILDIRATFFLQTSPGTCLLIDLAVACATFALPCDLLLVCIFCATLHLPHHQPLRCALRS